MKDIVSPWMVNRYCYRTKLHIKRVQRNLQILSTLGSEHAVQLVALGRMHDHSKYTENELVPYIWLTHKYADKDEAYPDGMEKRVADAVQHHYANNKHHPEYWADISDMTELSLIEMVCDWSAMGQEKGESSAIGWAEKAVTKHGFTDSQTQFIFGTIERLEDELKNQPKLVTSIAVPPSPHSSIFFYERSSDPWHKDAFPSRFKHVGSGGSRADGWGPMDGAGNMIGFVADGTEVDWYPNEYVMTESYPGRMCACESQNLDHVEDLNRHCKSGGIQA